MFQPSECGGSGARAGWRPSPAFTLLGAETPAQENPEPDYNDLLSLGLTRFESQDNDVTNSNTSNPVKPDGEEFGD
jgi:hypothetical protein